jgi:hypothetical protein
VLSNPQFLAAGQRFDEVFGFEYRLTNPHGWTAFTDFVTRLARGECVALNRKRTLLAGVLKSKKLDKV